jgi:acyl CoA:acetate/3-ketoacid CoA transferase beta subunit
MATRIEMRPPERLICVAARELEDHKNYFAGGGLPLIAFTLAQRRYAPDITYVAEWGVIDARSGVPAMGGAEADREAAAWESMNTVFAHAQLGLMDYGLLAALQIDPWGNINSSFIGGEYEGARERAGLPRGTGPHQVITTDAIFGFDDATRRMELRAVAEGLGVDDVKSRMGFEPLVADRVDVIPEVTQEEVDFLRREIFAKLRLDAQTIAL